MVNLIQRAAPHHASASATHESAYCVQHVAAVQAALLRTVDKRTVDKRTVDTEKQTLGNRVFTS
jgi:hypothetical protein